MRSPQPRFTNPLSLADRCVRESDALLRRLNESTALSAHQLLHAWVVIASTRELLARMAAGDYRPTRHPGPDGPGGTAL